MLILLCLFEMLSGRDSETTPGLSRRKDHAHLALSSLDWEVNHGGVMSFSVFCYDLLLLQFCCTENIHSKAEVK